ncbi:MULTISPECIES: alpha/beta fold hydrolase [Dermacoccus]|nr:alpha/beta hydrolase [Dermacoccus abyssi]
MAAEFIDGPSGALEVVRAGRGEPVTVFAHGMGASIPSTRPYASGVDGTRVFFHFRSHGRSAPAFDGWDYDHTADELLAVADACGATRALGVSMGGGSILRILQRDPSRFERVVLVIPAVIDSPRNSEGLERYSAMAEASARGDAGSIRAQLEAELPEAVRGDDAARAWVEQQTEVFLGPGMAEALRDLPHAVPVPDVERLRDLTLPVLVLAQEGDTVHPVSSAERLVEYLPNARLEVFDENGLLWGHRSRVRQVVGAFLSDDHQN